MGPLRSLALACSFAVAIFAARFLYTGHPTFGFLLWNLTLALVPVVLALPHRGGMLRFGIWLAFFPNAPYLVTDLVHLRQRGAPLWFDVGLIAAFAWAGLLASCVALHPMRLRVERARGRRAGWVFVVVVAALSGFGIWIGRFARLNSWDVVTHPGQVVRAIAGPIFDPMNSGQPWAVTALFGAFVFVAYASFASFRDDSPASKGTSLPAQARLLGSGPHEYVSTEVRDPR
ncbi:MAG: DUF1361 domain-containing protein [Myxococcota bacterium]